MKLILHTIVFHVCLLVTKADDLFNYGYVTEEVDGETVYRMSQWDQVSCGDEDTCRGWPDKFSHGKGWNLGSNNCEWCPNESSCGGHRQSPIDLKRDRAVWMNANYVNCRDWHWMQYLDDTCSWEDMKNQFQIMRHALRMQIPIRDDGEIDCFVMAGGVPKRRFPRLDYSKGFPDWWWLDAVDISVPSHHTQEGKRYDAEVSMEHFYEIDHVKNQVGHVTMFMDAYPDIEPWPYLDKLICAWREEEERQRADCGIEVAPPYGRCRIFTERGQEPTQEWLEEAGIIDRQGNPVTDTPTEAPTGPLPTQSPTPDGTIEPTQWELPVLFQPVFLDPDATDTPTIASTTLATSSPTSPPTSNSDQTISVQGNAPDIDCSSFSVDYNRMCQGEFPCCEADYRGESEFCHRLYDSIFPGDLIFSACQHCCTSEPKVGPPPKPEKPGVPLTTSCFDVSQDHNLRRVCKPDSCCEGQTDGDVCGPFLGDFTDQVVEEICWYCCTESRDYTPQTRRTLRGTMSDHMESAPTENGGTKVLYKANGEKRVLRPESFEGSEDVEKYRETLYSEFDRRTLQENATLIHEEDYEDVPYWPYEWLLKVGTEYYYRYEGTLVVPPCWEHVHWRVLKDPIRVHPRQIAELTRLLKERIAPKGEKNECNPDTAGVTNPDGSFKMNRDLQFTKSNHRKEFCECQDWRSKFVGDQEWCRNYKEDNHTRFYDKPYSFDSDGQW